MEHAWSNRPPIYVLCFCFDSNECPRSATRRLTGFFLWVMTSHISYHMHTSLVNTEVASTNDDLNSSDPPHSKFSEPMLVKCVQTSRVGAVTNNNEDNEI